MKDRDVAKVIDFLRDNLTIQTDTETIDRDLFNKTSTLQVTIKLLIEGETISEDYLRLDQRS